MKLNKEQIKNILKKVKKRQELHNILTKEEIIKIFSKSYMKVLKEKQNL